jgi:hypothetical protein
MAEPVAHLVSRDLMDRLQSVLPSAQPAHTAARVLEVMRRISRATSASAYRERAGMLRFVAGRRLPEAALRSIRTAMRHERGGSRSIWVGEAGAPAWERSWVMWSGRPHDAERDVVYLSGASLRAPEDCGERLARLAALLAELP